MAALSSASSWLASLSLILKNQPAPSGSELASDGSARRLSLTAVIAPETGMYTAAGAFTDSTTPATSPCAKCLPTSGRSTNTTSPSASWACTVMPTTAAVASAASIHSWSLENLMVIGGFRGGKEKNRPSAAVVRRHEGHGPHLHRHGLAAHDGMHARAWRGKGGADIAHRHGLGSRGAGQAAGDGANLAAVAALQFGVFAHRH